MNVISINSRIIKKSYYDFSSVDLVAFYNHNGNKLTGYCVIVFNWICFIWRVTTEPWFYTLTLYDTMTWFHTLNIREREQKNPILGTNKFECSWSGWQ